MLSSNNLLGRIITNKIQSYIKTLAPNATRTYHIITNSIASGSTSSTSLFNKSIMSPIKLLINSNFLTPVSPILSQVAGFKVKGRLRRRCKDCYFVMRQQRLYVICKTHPRHKQMAMKARDYKSWILTHATQSKIRPY